MPGIRSKTTILGCPVSAIPVSIFGAIALPDLVSLKMLELACITVFVQGGIKVQVRRPFLTTIFFQIPVFHVGQKRTVVSNSYDAHRQVFLDYGFQDVSEHGSRHICKDSYPRIGAVVVDAQGRTSRESQPMFVHKCSG